VGLVDVDSPYGVPGDPGLAGERPDDVFWPDLVQSSRGYPEEGGSGTEVLRLTLGCPGDLLFKEGGGDLEGGVVLGDDPFDDIDVAFEIAFVYGVFHPLDEFARPALFDVAGGGKRDACDLDPGVVLDHPEFEVVFRADEGDGTAGPPCPCRPADAVDVVVDVLGDVVVDDQVDVVDVDPPGGDVRRDKDVDRSGTELCHDAVTQHLFHVAVEPFGKVAPGLEVGGEFVDAFFGVCEDQGEVGVV